MAGLPGADVVLTSEGRLMRLDPPGELADRGHAALRRPHPAESTGDGPGR